jgi:hypothetical protein
LKTLIKIEEVAMLVLSIYALNVLKSPWWYYLLLALGPDISMVGYLGGNRVGAVVYNLFHHKAVAILVFLIGAMLGEPHLQAAGIILFGHSTMDRALGFGLKYQRGFKFTHLNGDSML